MSKRFWLFAAGPVVPFAGVAAAAFPMLRQDPQMRQAFLAKVSAPIVNTMFVCGMIA